MAVGWKPLQNECHLVVTEAVAQTFPSHRASDKDINEQATRETPRSDQPTQKVILTVASAKEKRNRSRPRQRTVELFYQTACRECTHAGWARRNL